MPSSPRDGRNAKAKMQSDSIRSEMSAQVGRQYRSKQASPSGSKPSTVKHSPTSHPTARVAKSTGSRQVITKTKPSNISSHSDYKPSKGPR